MLREAKNTNETIEWLLKQAYKPHLSKIYPPEKHFCDAVRCAMLIREQFQEGSGLDQPTVEFVVPLVTDPVFI